MVACVCLEAFTAVHQMHSRWLDVGMQLASFHLQSEKYDKYKPPCFGSYPEIGSLVRERERVNEQTLEDLQEQLDQEMILEKRDSMRFKMTRSIHNLLTKNYDDDNVQMQTKAGTNENDKKNKRKNIHSKKHSPSHHSNHSARPHVKMIGPSAGSIMSKCSSTTATDKANASAKKNNYPSNLGKESLFTKAWEPSDGPSPFLEEAAHLLSLLSAVSMSTLRNDLASAASPLITFKPNEPFPHVDPDAYNADVRKEWTKTHWSVAIFKYLFGLSRSPQDRTLYNAARPFRVIGGVSDAEIELLQAARGPLAKVALCSMWLQEFISREYLAGSLGAVAPPIVSRLYQFASDGMLGYNQARKIAYIPFPFPHAQVTSFFVLVVVGLMPVLMLTFVTNEAYAFCLNLLTVMCFTGLHEVARELENPFQNVPNDIPLNNFQVQYNEALMSMFRGYHPDAFWVINSAANSKETLNTVKEDSAE